VSAFCRRFFVFVRQQSHRDPLSVVFVAQRLAFAICGVRTAIERLHRPLVALKTSQADSDGENVRGSVRPALN
jgi:hypothetical protein